MGIKPEVDLPGVGENLQDQPNLSLIYPGSVNISGYAPYATFATAQDIFGDNLPKVVSDTKANLSLWAREASERSGLPAEALEKVLNIQFDVMFNENATIAELLTTGSGNLLVSAFWLLFPLSRGSVHLQSTALGLTDYPAIDPGFFRTDFDFLLEVALGKLAESYWFTEPVKDLVANNTSPGPSTDAEWASYIGENSE